MSQTGEKLTQGMVIYHDTTPADDIVHVYKTPTGSTEAVSPTDDTV